MEKKIYFYHIFSPISFIIFLIIAYIFYILPLTKSIKQPNFLTTLFVVSSLIYFLMGFLFCYFIFYIYGYKNKKRSSKKKIKIVHNKKIIYLIWLFYLISISLFMLEHLHFYNRFGAPPIFHPNFEVLRFQFPINGYIHMLAMMNYIFLFILIIDFFYYKKDYKRRKLYTYLLIIASIFSILLGVGIGSRGIVLNFLAIIFIAMNLKKIIYPLKLVSMVFLVNILLYIFGAFKLIRDYFFYGDYIFTNIKEDWLFGNIPATYPLYFTYLAFAMSFNILNMYIENLGKNFWGYFSIFFPFYSLLPGKQYNLKDLQEDVLGIYFHGTLTATIFSVPYIDFNFAGVIIFFFLGFITGFWFFKLVLFKEFKLRYTLIYSYFYWQLILGLYGYPFGQFYILFNMFVIYIFSKLIEKKVYERF